MAEQIDANDRNIWKIQKVNFAAKSNIDIMIITRIVKKNPERKDSNNNNDDNNNNDNNNNNIRDSNIRDIYEIYEILILLRRKK